MRESEFIGALDKALYVLPLAQRQDILAEYRSHFFEARERGKNEEDVAKGLGDPKTIAQTYIADFHFDQWQNPDQGQSVSTSVSHFLRGILVMMSLLFFNFFFMLWPLLFVFIVLFVTWVVVPVMTFVSFIMSFAAFLGHYPENLDVNSPLAAGFYCLGFGFIGLLSIIVLWKVSRALANGILRYIKLNLNLMDSAT